VLFSFSLRFRCVFVNRECEKPRSSRVLAELSGAGAYGDVFKGVCREKEVAVKVFNKKVEDERLKNFRREIDICSKIFHPNIVLFLGYLPLAPPHTHARVHTRKPRSDTEEPAHARRFRTV
jgi:hypothetical protein